MSHANLVTRLQHINALMGIAPQDAASKHARQLLETLINELKRAKEHPLQKSGS